jgi:para-nitrobenzyl esterase
MTASSTAPIDGQLIQATTTAGSVKGSWNGGVARFAGIPYAASPGGTTRFRPPAPVEPWTGVRDATEFSNICPQNPSVMEMLFGTAPEPQSEDCLALNIWTEAPTAEGRPVMVWIHGGGFEMGSGSSPLYNGTSFARRGAVVVSINYRLGSLGFLDLSSFDSAFAQSGSLGLLDQIAALEWVKDNIESFGGDPDNVTIFGESAGAMSVSLLMTAPKAKGLFRRAIAQSGAASTFRTPDAGAQIASEFMSSGGFGSVDQLIESPTAELLAAHAAMSQKRFANPVEYLQRSANPSAILAFVPVADGLTVPTDPLAAIASGCAADVDLLIGSNAEEWKLFSMMVESSATDAALRERIEPIVDDPDDAIAAYRAEFGEGPTPEIEGAMITDLIFRMPAISLAEAQLEHADVWKYQWRWGSPAMGGMLGACHAIELPFVFEIVDDPRLEVMVGPEPPKSLATSTNEAWSAFATSGMPTATHLPEWPSYDTGNRPVMVLDSDCALEHDPHPTSRKYWLERS